MELNDHVLFLLSGLNKELHKKRQVNQFLSEY